MRVQIEPSLWECSTSHHLRPFHCLYQTIYSGGQRGSQRLSQESIDQQVSSLILFLLLIIKRSKPRLQPGVNKDERIWRPRLSFHLSMISLTINALCPLSGEVQYPSNPSPAPHPNPSPDSDPSPGRGWDSWKAGVVLFCTVQYCTVHKYTVLHCTAQKLSDQPGPCSPCLHVTVGECRAGGEDANLHEG